MEIHKIRQEYPDSSLDLEDLKADPFDQFSIWLKKAIEREILEPNATTLATANSQGRPSSRTVLLKKIDSKGFIFFTNFESRKVQEMTQNPYASMTFFWKELNRQVCLEGTIEEIFREESRLYFHERPRGSQLGAWASKQDDVISSRKVLEEEYRRLEKLYEGQEIPLPPFWGGFRLIPTQFEFWQGRRDRLHDRFRYSLVDKQWKIVRVSP